MRTFSFVIGAAPAMFIIACATADNANLVEPPVLNAGTSGSGGNAGAAGKAGEGGKAGAAGKTGKGGSNNGGSDPFGGGGGAPHLPCNSLCGPGTECVELSPGREECLPEGATGKGGSPTAGAAGAPNAGGAAGSPAGGSGNGGNAGSGDPCMGACGENTVCDPSGPWCVLAPSGGAAGQSGAGGNGGAGGDPCMGACDPQTTHCEQGPNGPWCVPNLVRLLKSCTGMVSPRPILLCVQVPALPATTLRVLTASAYPGHPSPRVSQPRGLFFMPAIALTK